MSSGSVQHSSSPRREQQRASSSRSRSREKKNEREHRDRDRDRKIKIKVPELSAPLSNFKYFSNLQSEKIGGQTLQKAYDKYKRDWEQRQNEEFIKEYKKDAWFSEKYDPEVLDLLERDRKQGCRRQYTDFMAKLSAGSFDKINLTAKDPNELGIVEKFDEDEQQNSALSYILNQTFDVHVNPQNQIYNQPIFGFDQDLNTLFIKAVPRTISRYDIRGVVQKLEGYKNLTMSDPVKKANLSRYCWIEFQSEQSCNKAVLSLSGLMIKNETLVVTKSTSKMKRVKILKNYPVSRTARDIKTMILLIQKLDEEVGIQNNELLTRQFISQRMQMDICLLYLRRVHAYDYYTSSSYQNERILTLKVSSAFLRIEADYEQLQNVQTVFKKIQEKAEERIQKGSQIRDYMGILREEIEVFIRETEKLQKDQQKEVWKCLYCDKKFKTCEFLSKHMIAKHEEIKFKKIQTVMERLYMEDPLKITFASLMDREQRFKKPYNPNYRREKRREYRDFDEPQGDKNKPAAGGRQMVNFLDI